MICRWMGLDWIADTFGAHLRPAGTHIRTAKIQRTLQGTEKIGPISSTPILLRRSYTFKEHLRLYFNPCSLTVCAFGANIARSSPNFGIGYDESIRYYRTDVRARSLKKLNLGVRNVGIFLKNTQIQWRKYFYQWRALDGSGMPRNRGTRI